MKRRTMNTYTTGPWTIENGELIAPVTMMVEGVHNGSMGPLFWPAHVLEAAASSWNNTPVSLNHPTRNGNPISIKDAPRQVIGRVTDVYYDPAKKALKGKVRIPANHPQASQIQNVKEVSVGIFSDETYTPGNWNGENYIACAIAMTPDHLALLPDAKGACSWEDGCGVRNNSNQQLLVNALITAFKYLSKQGEITMNENEKLLPPGIEEKEDFDLQALQDAADRENMLLPAEFNRTTVNTARPSKADGEVEPLLPPGMNQ